VCVWEGEREYGCAFLYVFVCVWEREKECVCVLFVCVSLCVCVCVKESVYMCVYVFLLCLCVWESVWMWMLMCVCVCVTDSFDRQVSLSVIEQLPRVINPFITIISSLKPSKHNLLIQNKLLFFNVSNGNGNIALYQNQLIKWQLWNVMLHFTILFKSVSIFYCKIIILTILLLWVFLYFYMFVFLKKVYSIYNLDTRFMF